MRKVQTMSGIKKKAEIELEKAIKVFYKQIADISDPVELCEIYWLIVATHNQKVLEVIMGMPIANNEEAMKCHLVFAQLPNTVCFIFEGITRAVFCRNCCGGNKKLVKKGLEAYLNGEIINNG